ncbi:MAG: HupE/UreJ family protein [Pseudomonadota bacterium]
MNRLPHRFMLLLMAPVAVAVPALAHDVSATDAARIVGASGPQFALYVELGAKHMITGLDHVLFLLGVMFYADRMRTVLTLASLFAAGHTITLLTGVVWALDVHPYLVDAIIGLSVAYKGFDNLGGFERILGHRPSAGLVVFVFGLFHGLGLATKIQDVGLPEQGLITNLIGFNVGVELGQIGALTGILVVLALIRRAGQAVRLGLIVNTALITAGVALFIDQFGRFMGY